MQTPVNGYSQWAPSNHHASSIPSPVFAPPWTDSAQYAPQPLISRPRLSTVPESEPQYDHYAAGPSQPHTSEVPGPSQHLTAPLASLPAPPQPQQPPHFTSLPLTASYLPQHTHTSPTISVNQPVSIPQFANTPTPSQPPPPPAPALDIQIAKLRVLRPIYARKVALPEDQQGPSDVIAVSTSTDLLDVHIAFISWVINAISYIMVSATTTQVSHLIAVTVVGFGAAHTPIIRSLVVSSVDPLQQGEVLAAIKMMSSIGAFLSPLVMGGIFTVTISTQPMLVFYIHAAIVIAAASLLFLIRESDRY
ncbi:hypothetical protein EV702DRAFT_1245881 [Suillus placidus]|uniref:Uncharacterized protein n=1 Tax=Suillus placidus TaxID=48579 RepID=A0A9P6ZPM2_9AGAM|nr:hypothetical protein EV702DRAFT_1245881 [Suillus placidus]